MSEAAFYKSGTGVAHPLEEVTVAEMALLRSKDILLQGYVTRGIPIFWCEGDLVWPLPEDTA